MTVTRPPRSACPRFDRRSPIARAGARGRAPPPGAAAAADLRDPLRDGRRAQHRRPRDDPLGVVGRGAQRLRLVVVLLRSPAHLGRRRRGRVRRRVVVRLPRVAPRSRRGCSAISVVGLVVVLVPGVGIMVDGSRRWLGVGPIRVQPSEVAKLALLCCGANVLARRADRLHDWRQWMPVLVLLGVLGLPRDARARPRLRDRARADRVRAARRERRAPAPPRDAGQRPRSVLVTALAFAAPYRRARMLAFLHPWKDQANTGYQIAQSLIALGSGGVNGVGLGAGPRQVDVPAQRAHRLHLRGDRRGARA